MKKQPPPIWRSIFGGVIGGVISVLLLISPSELIRSSYYRESVFGVLFIVMWPSALIGLMSGLVAWRFRLKRRGLLNIALSLLFGIAAAMVVWTALFASFLYSNQPHIIDIGLPIEPVGRYLWFEKEAIAVLSLLVGGASALFTLRRNDISELAVKTLSKPSK